LVRNGPPSVAQRSPTKPKGKGPAAEEERRKRWAARRRPEDLSCLGKKRLWFSARGGPWSAYSTSPPGEVDKPAPPGSCAPGSAAGEG
jgi:hypothetical protein